MLEVLWQNLFRESTLVKHMETVSTLRSQTQKKNIEIIIKSHFQLKFSLINDDLEVPGKAAVPEVNTCASC